MTKKSAQKQQRVATRRQQRNKSIRSQVKTYISQAEKVIFTGDPDAAREAVKNAVISLDKAAEKDILHWRNASRRKARLLKKLNQVAAESETVSQPEEAA